MVYMAGLGPAICSREIPNNMGLCKTEIYSSFTQKFKKKQSKVQQLHETVRALGSYHPAHVSSMLQSKMAALIKSPCLLSRQQEGETGEEHVPSL